MGRRSDNMTGALLMVACQVTFTVNDTFMKSLSGDLPFFQAIFLRGVIVAVLMLGLAWWMGQLAFRVPRRDIGLLTLRTAGEVGAAFFYVSALFHMPIANAIAILQVVPLAVALGAWMFLGEPLGWRRLLAIAVGFVGVMLIVRPGMEGFTIWSLYALAGVLSVALRDLATRRMTVSLPSLTIAFTGSIGVALFAAVGASLTEWAPISALAAAQVTGASVALVAAYLMAVAVMRVGDIAFVAPFRYASLVSALILGLVVFGDWPDALTLAGASIVAATGLYTFWREQAVARKAARI